MKEGCYKTTIKVLMVSCQTYFFVIISLLMYFSFFLLIPPMHTHTHTKCVAFYSSSMIYSVVTDFAL